MDTTGSPAVAPGFRASGAPPRDGDGRHRPEAPTRRCHVVGTCRSLTGGTRVP